MLVYLYGSDSYRLNQRLSRIILEYKKKHSSLTHDHFYLDQKEELERLKNFTVSQSLFDKSKLGIVHNLKDELKEIKNILKPLLEDKNTTLVIAADKKLGKAFDFLLKKPVLSENFEPLKNIKFNAFIKKEIERKNIKIKESTVKELADIYEGDSFKIITELEKLSLGGEIETRVKIPDFFPLVQTLKSKLPLASRLRALSYLIDSEEPAAVFNIFSSIADIETKKRLADYDGLIKSGKLDYEEALTDLALAN